MRYFYTRDFHFAATDTLKIMLLPDKFTYLQL